MNHFTAHARGTALAFLAVAAACLLLPIANAMECVATSGPQRVAILELYTSEGCDSCPPADKWVGELPARKLTAERVVPLAFHVDYWNQLGWVDPYSQAAFSDRQRQHSSRRGVSFVVTPQLLLNGQDYRRGMLFDDFERTVNAINQSKPQAAIRIGVTTGSSMLSGKIDVSVADNAERAYARVYLALYENNLVSTIVAGENKGHTLKHNFVVRNLIGPLALNDKGDLSHTQRFALNASWKRQDLNLAVFVQHAQTGDVLQALVANCR